ncbi:MULTISPECIES: ATP-binding cassette domain-containing protein [unclassified Sphingomonas]|uniref:ATP-binding cassette domain-containing protein n=1 Tax=unclassified Sphingomonas TaxID=196159 RepID=UPI0009290011|nr:MULTISPECIES: ATP-binding cassette domain-containing protein [unclassified Sphingomonas]OJU16340.1 MAG: molybdenum ABC transporter ATP-binding protein [Sphingomonas sp. 66-10]
MSFDIDVTLRRGDALVATAFVAEEQAVALVGPSGVGKTSVLDMIAGLLRPDRGHVRVGGRVLTDRAARVEVPAHHRRAGYVFQDARLFPHLDVRRNLLYGAKDAARLATIAASLDIAHLLDRWPRALSGGEARRVAIGRALLSDPEFLLLDEPLSSLDALRREEAMRLIERVRDDSGLPLLLVTHDEREAERLCARVVRM